MGNFSDVVKNIGGIASIASTIATPVVNWFSQRATNKQNAAINDSNQEFNAEQSKLEREFNSSESAKSRVFNAQQAKQQQDFQERMWNTYNMYNSPLNQVERMRRAGYNPNWLDVSGNTPASIPQGASATSSPASVHGISAPNSLPMQAPQFENPVLMASQIRLARAQADKAESDAKRTNELLPYEKETANANIRVANSNVSLNDAKADNLSSSSRLNDQKVQESQETVKFMQMDEQEKKFNLERLHDRWMMEVHEFNNRILESNSRIELAKGQIKELVSRACLNYANAQNANDIHLLNGLELHFINGMSEANKDYYCKLRWDAEIGKYDVELDSQETEKVSNERSRQRISRRNEDNIYNTILDYVSDLDDALGRPFGAGFQFGYKRYSKGD